MVTPVDVAVIGLGSMGLGMAGSLIRAGLSVAGCDLSEAARARLGEFGGRSAATPAEAATGAGALLVVVVNAAQTEAVLFGDHGAAAVLRPGAVVIASATMAPADARRLAARVEALGLHYLDAPISGGAGRYRAFCEMGTERFSGPRDPRESNTSNLRSMENGESSAAQQGFIHATFLADGYPYKPPKSVRQSATCLRVGD